MALDEKKNGNETKKKERMKKERRKMLLKVSEYHVISIVWKVQCILWLITWISLFECIRECTQGHRELIEQCTQAECIGVILGRIKQSTQLNDNKSEREKEEKEWNE